MKKLLLIPHLQINNANALSSPYTVGFPAVTAWLGAVHALQRSINKSDVFSGIRFDAVSMVSHDFLMRSYKPGRTADNVLVGMAFPLDKNGNRASFIEEAKCALEVSLVIDVKGLDPADSDQFCNAVYKIILNGMHVASGDVVSLQHPTIVAGEDDYCLRILKKNLMPGYVLIERRELMQEIMEEGSDSMDALLANLAVCYSCSSPENPIWEASRKNPGWIVPIGVGYQRISDFFVSRLQRDPSVPHTFAESVVTLGEFIMPYRLKNLADMFWVYMVDEKQGLYLCRNNKYE
jgi:CRISPR-associated protein Csy2